GRLCDRARVQPRRQVEHGRAAGARGGVWDPQGRPEAQRHIGTASEGEGQGLLQAGRSGRDVYGPPSDTRRASWTQQGRKV
ncbi:hypothetical protein EV182_008757, partial [Spiromyces aspiralis]